MSNEPKPSAESVAKAKKFIDDRFHEYQPDNGGLESFVYKSMAELTELVAAGEGEKKLPTV